MDSSISIISIEDPPTSTKSEAVTITGFYPIHNGEAFRALFPCARSEQTPPDFTDKHEEDLVPAMTVAQPLFLLHSPPICCSDTFEILPQV